ncbi:zinc-dependent alcohol dehydrogenase family protein [Thalassococcus sp. S3]|uniref:zinc-dependent alcohol dehydrogenase family protein n=1 Tax=Thalassococcus sp. S3 TaxID=2017482 RepID=UPI001023FA49|nr:zinc-dependent alcohol dehydrogenase family protein [Thalassococcus sp. S3]QBF29649.1 alcohol dehydrogenase [Thalassococcus sp. S3]
MDNTALIYDRFGPPLDTLRLCRSQMLDRKEADIRVRMRFAPINPSDLIPITGAYRHRIQLPQIAGYEGVGEVVEAPESHDDLIGRRVLPLKGSGTWQHYVDCDPAWAVPVPNEVPDDLAARAYINPMAARLMLKTWPVEGKSVLLTAGSSDCAGLLLTWAIGAGASDVTAVYRSPLRSQALQRKGAEPVAMDDSTSIIARARKADVVFDAVGGALGTSILEAMREGADFVSYGLLSNRPVIPSKPIVGRHQRFHLREAQAGFDAARWQAEFTALWGALDLVTRPPIKTFSLPQWQEALRAFWQPGRSEKPMLDLKKV